MMDVANIDNVMQSDTNTYYLYSYVICASGKNNIHIGVIFYQCKLFIKRIKVDFEIDFCVCLSIRCLLKTTAFLVTVLILE